jgi:hypothetical protein
MIKKIITLTFILLLTTQLGCARKTTQTTVNPDFSTTTTVTEHGFWESENHSNHLKFESNRVDKHAESVNTKVNAITEQAALASVNAVTPTEKVLINVLAMTYLSNVPTTPNPSGIQPPKVAVDLWNSNLIGLGHLALGAYVTFFDDDFRSNNSHTANDSPSIENNGAGDVFYMSDYNKNPNFNLTGENHPAFNMDTTFAPSSSSSSTKIDDNEYGLF